MPIDTRLSAEVSRALNEPLYGTIKASDVYFLLEYNGNYAHDAWGEADIPAAVKEKIQTFPNSHRLLIRQPGQSGETDKQITLFIVHANTDVPRIYRINVPDYDAILALDFSMVLEGDAIPASEEPLYTVCTNGKRDICCSKYGMLLYNALTAVAGDAVWQSSHIGGHRFAATMYCFPHALCYGFLTPEDAPEIVNSYREGRLLLNKLRGRGIMKTVEQIADYFLRRELDEDHINAVRVLDVTNGNAAWDVRLQVADTTYLVHIAQAEPMMVLSTTGDEQYKPVAQFKFMGYEQL
jgi:hypothetical protein